MGRLGQEAGGLEAAKHCVAPEPKLILREPLPKYAYIDFLEYMTVPFHIRTGA